MNYCTVKKVDIADGVGVRCSLFVSGCTHHCPGCFNPETWDFTAGEPFGEEVQKELLETLSLPYICGLSLLGGEPFEPVNQRALLPFLLRVKELYPQKNIWCYTGYVYDRDLLPGGRAYCEATDPMLDLIDVLVDGPFVLAKKDISLKFRGSSNQRLIDLRRTRQEGRLYLLD